MHSIVGYWFLCHLKYISINHKNIQFLHTGVPEPYQSNSVSKWNRTTECASEEKKSYKWTLILNTMLSYNTIL